MFRRRYVIRSRLLASYYGLFRASVNITAWEIDYYFKRLPGKRLRAIVSASCLPTYCSLFYWILDFIRARDRHKFKGLPRLLHDHDEPVSSTVLLVFWDFLEFACCVSGKNDENEI
jgi:hypothetical protein